MQIVCIEVFLYLKYHVWFIQQIMEKMLDKIPFDKLLSIASLTFFFYILCNIKKKIGTNPPWLGSLWLQLQYLYEQSMGGIASNFGNLYI